MAKRIEKWIDDRGAEWDTEAEADESNMHIMMRDDFAADGIGWMGAQPITHLRQAYAILKKHLEPVEAPIDETKAADELAKLITLPGKVIDDGAWLAVQVMASMPREVVAILQGIERPEPISEQQAEQRLEDMMTNSDGEWASHCEIIDLFVARRAEVIAILQAVR